ncbi:MAG: hypothetical protein IPM79_36170 [Polyangiaceae bacterium]|nr:hypothetical protein [Polyangiaceae bacterium]
MNIDELYVVLRGWAIAKKIHTYLDLSKQYEARTHEWFEPHGSWDVPLGSLNLHLHQHGAPALSALVVVGRPASPAEASGDRHRAFRRARRVTSNGSPRGPKS